MADAPTLNPRQQEVMYLVERGLSIQEIADELGFSHSGAKFHTDALRRKFGVTHRRYLIPLAADVFDEATRDAIRERIARAKGSQ